MNDPSGAILAPQLEDVQGLGVLDAEPECAMQRQVAEALAEDLDSGFVLLFRTYQRQMFSIALRVSGRRAEAEDITSDAFLRAYRALTGYPPDRTRTLRIRPWLTTILVNGWRNRQRTAARQPTAPLDEAEEPVDPAKDVATAVTDRETGAELAALLTKLSHPQRVAVVLRHVARLSITEIAEVMGCAEGTARSHVSRGLARLRALHGELAEGGVR